MVPFSSLKFSYDGQKILAVNESTVYVIEAFEGRVLLKAKVGMTLSNPNNISYPLHRGTRGRHSIGSILHT